MKYEKPTIRNLGDLSLAGGNCASGIWVGTCYNGRNAGDCSTSGERAGTCSTTGVAVGAPVNCLSTGNYATTTCATGDTAR
jgi:hypothetical protein